MRRSSRADKALSWTLPLRAAVGTAIIAGCVSIALAASGAGSSTHTGFRPTAERAQVATASVEAESTAGRSSRGRSAAALYLHARAAYLRASLRNLKSGETAASKLVASVESQCPQVVSGSPLEPSIQPASSDSGHPHEIGVETDRAWLVEQVGDAVYATVLSSGEQLAKRFASATRTLRWRDSSVERHLDADLEYEARRRQAAIPPLCEEMQAWVASGYTAVPGQLRSERATIVGVNVNGPGPLGPDLQMFLIPGGLHVARLLDYLYRAAPRRLGGQLEAVASLEVKLLDTEYRQARALAGRLLHHLGFYASGALFSGGGTAAIAFQSLQEGIGRAIANAGSPYKLQVPVPPAVRHRGGAELRQFEAGRRAVAAAGCAACHRIDESGNPGPGRPLSHIGAALSEPEIRHALLDARAPMPSFRHLPPQKLRDIVRFLSLLK